MMLQGGALGGRADRSPKAWALELADRPRGVARGSSSWGELRKDMPGWLYRC
jgi:hypothetical protein